MLIAYSWPLDKAIRLLCEAEPEVGDRSVRIVAKLAARLTPVRIITEFGDRTFLNISAHKEGRVASRFFQTLTRFMLPSALRLIECARKSGKWLR